MVREHPLDEVFAAGPDGFVAERLARYLAVTGAPEPADAEPPEGADRVFELLSRPWDETSFVANYGVRVPAGYAELLRLVGGRVGDLFDELTVDCVPLPGVPAEENLFELVVLRNQALYLGTDLAEVFSGAICVGASDGGDTYHLDLYSDQALIFHYDHEEHLLYPEPIAAGLEPLVFVAALRRARERRLVGAAGFAAGVRAVSGRTDGNWPFELPFTPADLLTASSRAHARWERARWIIEHLQFGDPELFGGPDDDVDAPDDAAGEPACTGEEFTRCVPDALFTLWRAVLLDSDDAEHWLRLAREHPARLVRDAGAYAARHRPGRPD